VTGPRDFPYKLLAKQRGMTTGTISFHSPITGYSATLNREVGNKWVRCELFANGLLLVYPETTWDFGTGAIDTPDVVRASLAHDMFCHFTDLGLIPWKCRKVADRYYRELLIQYGCLRIRAWKQWSAVRLYSKTVAYWRREK
jgi:hypothetical protein